MLSLFLKAGNFRLLPKLEAELDPSIDVLIIGLINLSIAKGKDKKWARILQPNRSGTRP
jgi:hypothetical protein